MKILLIEDNPDIAELLKEGLEMSTHQVVLARNGQEGIDAVSYSAHDLIILDFYMPDINGDVVAERIRAINNKIPIIMLSVDTDSERKVKMLSLCDDYITKPFAFDELLARIQCVTRRSMRGVNEDKIQVGNLIIDLQAFTVERGGKKIRLRNKEFALLQYMMRNPDIVLSRGKILENVWGLHADPFTNTVDVHIRFLRKKIDKGFKKPMIQTIPKRGYKIVT